MHFDLAINSNYACITSFNSIRLFYVTLESTWASIQSTFEGSMIHVLPAGRTQVDRTGGRMESSWKGKIFPFMHLFEKELRSICFLLTPKRQEPPGLMNLI